MKVEYIAQVLHVKKTGDKYIVEAKAKQIEDNGSCQVGGTSDDPENPYCIDNGCGKCQLHSKDEGNGVTSYWCTCD